METSVLNGASVSCISPGLKDHFRKGSKKIVRSSGRGFFTELIVAGHDSAPMNLKFLHGEELHKTKPVKISPWEEGGWTVYGFSRLAEKLMATNGG